MEKSEDYVSLERKDQWVVIQLNHPPVNSLSLSLMNRLDEKLTEIAEDKEIHSVIITGVGKFFCCGG